MKPYAPKPGPKKAMFKPKPMPKAGPKPKPMPGGKPIPRPMPPSQAEMARLDSRGIRGGLSAFGVGSKPRSR